MNATLENLVHWCLTHGIVMGLKRPDIERDLLHFRVAHAPFALKPYDFSMSAFSKAIALAPLFSRLIDIISRDTDWILQTLQQTSEGDEFTRKLMDVFKTTLPEASLQTIVLSVNRSDYMLHEQENDPRKLLQVELNTIAASFGALSTKITEMHQAFYATQKEDPQLPINMALPTIAATLAAGHRAYVEKTRGSGSGSVVEAEKVVILMVIQGGERNFADQKMVQHELAMSHQVPTLRRTLSDLASCAFLSPTGSRALLLRTSMDADGDGSVRCVEVSVVYFRGGYGPEDYAGGDAATSAACWSVRSMMERARAVKVPTVAHQLVGTKKVQQMLAMPGELERFVSDADERAALREVFAGQYGLEGEAGMEAVLKARENPEGFVLKPQREGGGHNFYGQEVVRQLDTLSESERAAFVLMERIRPPSRPATLIREGVSNEIDCLCELGIYGVYLRVDEDVRVNECAGHLLRVKPGNVDEGGVAAGFAVLGSPKLVS